MLVQLHNDIPDAADAERLGGSANHSSLKTIDIDLYSDGATTGPWTVTAQAFARSTGTAPISFAFDQTTGQNGDTLHLTITANSASTSSSKTTTFQVTSTLGNPSTIWLGIVGN